jgi:hypothetical protein
MSDCSCKCNGEPGKTIKPTKFQFTHAALKDLVKPGEPMDINAAVKPMSRFADDEVFVIKGDALAQGLAEHVLS